MHTMWGDFVRAALFVWHVTMRTVRDTPSVLMAIALAMVILQAILWEWGVRLTLEQVGAGLLLAWFCIPTAVLFCVIRWSRFATRRAQRRAFVRR